MTILMWWGEHDTATKCEKNTYYVAERSETRLLMERRKFFRHCLAVKGKRILKYMNRYGFELAPPANMYDDWEQSAL
jgi:hypothetical protein